VHPSDCGCRVARLLAAAPPPTVLALARSGNTLGGVLLADAGCFVCFSLSARLNGWGFSLLWGWFAFFDDVAL